MSKMQYYHVDKFIKKYCGNPNKTLPIKYFSYYTK